MHTLSQMTLVKAPVDSNQYWGLNMY